MDAKQTPEQAAKQAMYTYVDGSNVDSIVGYKSIIKAFQDREMLLAVLEPLLADKYLVDIIHSDRRRAARAAISKAKEA